MQKSGVAAGVRQFIRQNRRSRVLGLLGSASEKYLRAYYNEGFYEFENNGEAFAMRIYRQWAADREIVIWDVGANAGQWSKKALEYFSNATIHAFEILPPIADAFEQKLGAQERVTLHRIGVSEGEGEVEVTWNKDHDQTSSIAYRDTDAFGTDFESVTCRTRPVDSLIADGLPAPDFLKIDTEGHDASVIRGARKLLESPQAPSMIQFEYGDTWLPARETLESIQKLLENAGYRVGRLYPDHVSFKRYDYRDDHFRMGNMIAAKPDDLIALLQG